MKLKRIIALFLVVTTAFLVTACNGGEGSMENEKEIELLSPSDGETVSLNHPEVENLLFSKTESEVAKILWKNHVSGLTRCDSQFVIFNWAYESGNRRGAFKRRANY